MSSVHIHTAGMCTFECTCTGIYTISIGQILGEEGKLKQWEINQMKLVTGFLGPEEGGGGGKSHSAQTQSLNYIVHQAIFISFLINATC